MRYTFPFSTCEAPRHCGWAQPFSAVANLIAMAVIATGLCLSRGIATRIFFGTLLAFEAWHTWSHIRHVDATFQTRWTHLLSYLVNLSLLGLLISLTGALPSLPFAAVLLGLALLDLWAYLRHSTICFIATQLSLSAAIILGYLSLAPAEFRPYFYGILATLITIVTLFVNERLHCEQMLRFANLPYHVLIEATGIAMFLLVVLVFVKWDAIVV